MDIYKPVSVEEVSVHNAIKTLGCNVLLFEGVGSIQWACRGHTQDAYTKYLERFKKKLIEKVLSKDGDYGQVAILNFGSRAFNEEIEASLREVFSVMFVSPIKGGHGNLPCTLVILDLSKLREEADIVAVGPYEEEDDDGYNEDDEEDDE